MTSIKLQIKSYFGKILFEYEKDDNTMKDTLERAVKDGANLEDAILDGAILDGAILRGANLRGVRTQDANLISIMEVAEYGCVNVGSLLRISLQTWAILHLEHP